MKILYPVLHGEVAGGNIVCLKIIEEMLKRGQEVAVVAPSEGTFTEILKKKGIPVYLINTKRIIYLHQVFALARLIKKEKVDLIHTHCTVAGNIISRLAGKIAGVPVISHIHIQNKFRDDALIRKSQIFLDNWTARLNNKIIAVSESTKKSLIKQGIFDYKIEVVHNGIDVDEIRPTRAKEEIYAQFSLKEDTRLIGTVARLCQVKGQKEFILAAKSVLKDFPDVCFMIVGEDLEKKGLYKDELMGLTKDLGISDKVIFTGFQKDPLSFINAFEIFALPSWVEGLPLVILEAMALRKPVIATAVGGNTEVIIGGATGTFVPVKNPDKLAEAIIYHLSNLKESKMMGEEGYKRAKEHFSLSVMLDRTMRIYAEAFKERKWQS